MLITSVAAQTDVKTLQVFYIERFTRFIEWPGYSLADYDEQPFVLGVIDGDDFGELLEKVYHKEKIKGHPVIIKYINKLTDITDCHLVLVIDEERFSVKQLKLATQNRPILLISTSDDFARKIGHINFFLENGKLRFAVNVERLKQSNLYVSHHLLKLATIVK